MRFGTWRGTLLALAAALGLGLGSSGSAHADGQLIQHTIPRSVVAYDFTTGRQYMAPPIPYGHYAKDYIGDLDKAMGCVSCRLHSLVGGGGAGHGLFHHGQGDGDCGSGTHGHGGGSACGVTGCGGGNGCKHMGHHGGSAGYACTQTPLMSPQAIQPSSQAICGQPGFAIGAKHSHLGQSGGHSLCGRCGGADSGLRSGPWPRERKRLPILRRQGLWSLHGRGRGARSELAQQARFAGRRGWHRPAEDELVRGPRRPGSLDPGIRALHRHHAIAPRVLRLRSHESVRSLSRDHLPCGRFAWQAETRSDPHSGIAVSRRHTECAAAPSV